MTVLRGQRSSVRDVWVVERLKDTRKNDSTIFEMYRNNDKLNS